MLNLKKTDNEIKGMVMDELGLTVDIMTSALVVEGSTSSKKADSHVSNKAIPRRKQPPVRTSPRIAKLHSQDTDSLPLSSSPRAQLSVDVDKHADVNEASVKKSQVLPSVDAHEVLHPTSDFVGPESVPAVNVPDLPSTRAADVVTASVSIAPLDIDNIVQPVSTSVATPRLL